MTEASDTRRLERLPELAYNLLWSWHPETQELFARLDPELWEQTGHNPVRLLQETTMLEKASGDAGVIESYYRCLQHRDEYLARRDTWMGSVYPGIKRPVAYFSAEFGLHESLPIYSGGLGILAGDHVKSASDLGVPLVAVGILYSQGYFRQRLDERGVQKELYEPLAPETRPVRPALDGNGRELRVTVELPKGPLLLRVWRAEVGRASVLLLDAEVPENPPEYRELTARLYGGDARTRISQEMILGIGGVRALRAANIYPSAYHMNEGHAAFLGLERIRELTGAGRDFEGAREEVAANTVFTTHTPVPAGHDAFPPDLFWEFMERWPAALGTDRDRLWRLGLKENGEPRFNMTALAVNLSSAANAVSRIHRGVTEKMWNRPVTYITNGIHTSSWISPRMASLFDRHASGRAWREAAEDPSAWSFVEEIPDRELWEIHQSIKRDTVRAINSRMRLRGSSAELDPDALTIGFARRFATYKRATLLLSDTDRLRSITRDAERPVRFVFAGKAHPADEPGKQFIKELHRASEELDGSLIVLEDYDMSVARHLVQGVDVWLNNPRRPQEASGTSGQKASLNGIPNFSVPDGWWPEAYNGKNGWKIGDGEEHASPEEQDERDAASLYDILENSIVPLYYNRDEHGVPEGWVEVMKGAISTVAPNFSTQRMVQDYVHKLYAPRAAAARDTL